MNTLPDKPSELIRVAIKDLTAVEKMPEIYGINMGNWHRGSSGKSHKKCYVCLAGAVMSQSLNVSPTEFKLPSNFEQKSVCKKLMAINSFRVGWVSDGLEYMEIPPPIQFLSARIMPLYAPDPQEFKNAMLQLADDLEKEGL